MALNLTSYVAGKPVASERKLEVFYPYDGSLSGTVACASAKDLEQAISIGAGQHEPLTRFQRADILRKARTLLEERREEFAHLIRSEAGLCIRESTYEVGRTLDVLEFAAMEALKLEEHSKRQLK